MVEQARQYRMTHSSTNEKDKTDTIFESDNDIPQGDNKLKSAAKDIWRQARTKLK